MSVDPKAFWEEKILAWEEGRYQPETAKQGLMERIANVSSRSLRYRLQVSVELLAPHIQGKSVLEIGCGSGLLAQKIIAAGASSYHGIDIAESAIAIANSRKAEERWSDRITFAVGSISEMEKVSQDVVFSLGVLDWLTDDELDTLFRQHRTADFLHAIAEKRSTPSQYLHRAYVHFAYGYRTGAYRPRYFAAADIARLANRHGAGPSYAFRDPRLSFGALVSNLPIGTPIAI